MITTFGEIMLRISPKDMGERMMQATDFEIRPGGSESNVAIALANLGEKTVFVSALPDNPPGQKVIRQLLAESVETGFIKMTGERIGIYWTENGSGPRNSFVVYDRENSAFSKATFQDFDWDEILKQTQWFHFSGISPAVSESVATLLDKVVEKITCPYSVDLNFRNKLWSWVDKEPARITAVMISLCRKATLIAGNESDFQTIFGFDCDSIDEQENYNAIARQCFTQFTKLQYIAISNRISHSATLNDWCGYLFVRNDDKFCFKSIEYKLDNIQDRVGTGDSFVAGVIYGLNNTTSMSWRQIIDFAVTLGALNHTTKGDASHFSIMDVQAAMKSKGSGRILR
jgi:2-dehydro-3-deoxygluconokinase